MKKLLILLTSFSIATGGVSNVVSCAAINENMEEINLYFSAEPTWENFALEFDKVLENSDVPLDEIQNWNSDAGLVYADTDLSQFQLRITYSNALELLDQHTPIDFSGWENGLHWILIFTNWTDIDDDSIPNDDSKLIDLLEYKLNVLKD
ncbi:lipoprotein [Spiroplasma endosymbiont of Labia minor]|uniref:lipoprotein n=1 Tax=Spiroplasma endosymbiont of Labia minor TaxID=3066305 RepID=UPI0030CD2BE0